jgi:SAM-dependent methyltransferase
LPIRGLASRVETRALPAPNDAYDVVIAGLVLHFVNDPQLAVREMARTAHHGGAVAAYVWDFAGDRQFIQYFWRAATALDPAATAQDPLNQFPLCRPEPLAALFARAGLRAVTVEAVVVPTVFRHFDDYWQPYFLRGSSPAQRYVASLDDEQRAALRARLQSILPVAEDGSISLLGCLWAVRGTE